MKNKIFDLEYLLSLIKRRAQSKIADTRWFLELAVLIVIAVCIPVVYTTAFSSYLELEISQFLMICQVSFSTQIQVFTQKKIVFSFSCFQKRISILLKYLPTKLNIYDWIRVTVKIVHSR